ncbi:MAG: hypothetical protein ACE5R4_06740 [Armatimonadota bacterium]
MANRSRYLRLGRRGRRRGLALLIALFVVAVSLILMVAFMEAAAIEFSLAGSYERYASALYAADAGLADAVATLADGGTPAAASLSDVEFPVGSGHYYSTAVSGTGPSYTITAQGRSSDITRAVEAQVYIAAGKATVLAYAEVDAP